MLLRPIALFAVLFTASFAGAQTLVPQPAAEQPAVESHATFRSSVDLVTLNVTVTDAREQHVPGLNRADFQVLEDGVPQDLTFFAATELPLDVALLVDSSSSMREKMPFVRAAADRFVKSLKAGDQVEVVGFNSQVRVLQPFTADLASVEGAIGSVVPRGGTALYTALYVTLDQFMRTAKTADRTSVRRPAIILLTDGQDTASLIQFDDLLERARRAGVAIYSTSVVSPADAKTVENEGGRRYITDSDYALKTLAKETGARAFFPLELAELNTVYGDVAGELSTQYALGYAPRASRQDGAFHRLLVRVLSRPDARSRTRTGYYSPRANAYLLTPGAGRER